MNSPVQMAHILPPLVAGALVASVWQGALLTAGAAVGLRALRPIVPPAVRTWIWSAVLLGVLLLPMLAMTVPHPTAGHAEVHVAGSWSSSLFAVWALSSAALGVRLGVNAFRLHGVARRAVPVTVDARVRTLLEGPRRAALCLTAEVDRPGVAGFFRPRILLPAGLLESLSSTELEHVVLHEMEHLRRYDDWLNLLQQTSLVLLPLNPALLWLDRQMCRERELACDDGVLRATRTRKAYAACLVKLAEDSTLRKGMALALSALGSGVRESELVGRVRRILAGPERVTGAGHLPLTLGALAVVMLAGVTCLARSPQWIRFDGPQEMVAQAAVPAATPIDRTGMAAGGMLPVSPGLSTSSVSMRVEPAAVRPVLARVALAMARGRRVPVVTRRRVRVRSLAVRAAAERTRWGVEPAVPPSVGPAGRLVLTQFEVSQPMYAAVPWRGGWLIVQL